MHLTITERLNCSISPPGAQRPSIIALIDEAEVIERILKHLNVLDPQPNTLSLAGPDPPWPTGETLPLRYHPLPDIA